MATRGETQKPSPELSTDLPFDFLRKITNDFSDEQKIGSDTFGALYKGTVPDGGRVIAVKKLGGNTPLPSEEIFRTEVENILGLKHENLVELLAFCSETQKKPVEISGRYIPEDSSQFLLCYEYLPNGTLYQYLSETKAPEDSSLAEPSLDWDTRFKFVKGICHGLLYLHNLDKPIIHMNLNTKSIWLGENMVPKIGNFGLSRLSGDKLSSRTTTSTQTVVGSYGYMAPEYLYKGEISAQADIYSLGLIIIEISTREENSSGDKQLSGRRYIDKIRKDWTAEHIASMYPSYDAESLQQVYACIEIGLACVHLDPEKRPPIEEIIDRLDAI